MRISGTVHRIITDPDMPVILCGNAHLTPEAMMEKRVQTSQVKETPSRHGAACKTLLAASSRKPVSQISDAARQHNFPTDNLERRVKQEVV